jgi:Mn-containing catalase
MRLPLRTPLILEIFIILSPRGKLRFFFNLMGNPWTGLNVFSSGNLKLDLWHNFFLECGVRANKIRVYECAKSPTARAAVGYVLVRGGLHIVAYA